MFNAFCSAFLVLVVAEQAGIKAGIGWYMNFQVGMLQYQEMYACIILIALTFSGLITILFAVRSRMLVWQRGVIQW
jgi:NitT/TauT family transport system permease protein